MTMRGETWEWVLLFLSQINGWIKKEGTQYLISGWHGLAKIYAIKKTDKTFCPYEVEISVNLWIFLRRSRPVLECGWTNVVSMDSKNTIAVAIQSYAGYLPFRESS